MMMVMNAMMVMIVMLVMMVVVTTVVVMMVKMVVLMMVVVMALVPRSFHYQSVVCRMLLSFSCLQNPLAGFSCRRPGAVWPGVCLEIHFFDHHKKGIPEHLGGHVFGNPFSVQLKKGIPMQLVADHQIGECGGPPSQGITPPPQKRPSSCFYEPTSRALCAVNL